MSGIRFGSEDKRTASAGSEGGVTDVRFVQLLDTLSDAGALTPQARQRAERLAATTGERIDLLMPKLGIASETAVARAWAAVLDREFVSADALPDAAPGSLQVKPQFLRRRAVLPVAVNGSSMTLAVADPLDAYPAEALAQKTGLDVRVTLAARTDLLAAIDRCYPLPPAAAPTSDADGASELDDDVERLRDLASDAPIVAWVNDVIARAVEANASDIHVEPTEHGLRIRFRIDGVLRAIDPPDRSMAAMIVPRIKIMARLNISERRLPQDGRIRMTVRGRGLDIRVATAPNLHGESAALRLLDAHSAVLELSSLGFDPETLERYRRILHRPNGILLVTGPTGSGKTTTLYASLRELNTPDRKIFSVEDPIEYQLEGVNQIQVKPSIGLTFASALRSMLRHDPDIMMVGEIRDVETAQIAIESALTGHMVLSTLHTNSAAATLTRLAEMGLANYLLAATVAGVVGQRLVRRLCTQCREPIELAPGQLVGLGATGRTLADTGPLTAFAARGCSKCAGTGYQGRVAIHEVLEMTDRLRELIATSAGQPALQAAAIEEGMVPMGEDGLWKVRNGVTTLEEVLRVAHM